MIPAYMNSRSGVKVLEFNCPSKWSILNNVEPQAQNPQNLLLAATLLKLAQDEFKEGLVKNDAETAARLSALLERWSLIENGKIIDITNTKIDKLHIYSHLVLKKIKNKEEDWVDLVPRYVSEFIKSKKIFGYSD